MARCPPDSPYIWHKETPGKDPRIPPYIKPAPGFTPVRSASPRTPLAPHRAQPRFVTRHDTVAAVDVSGDDGCEAPTLGPRMLRAWQAGRKWAQRVGWVHEGYEETRYADGGCSELVRDLAALGYGAAHILPRRDGVRLREPHADLPDCTTLGVPEPMPVTDALATLRADSSLGLRGCSCPEPGKRSATVPCTFARHFDTDPAPGFVAFERCVPTARLAAELASADKCVTRQGAAERRWAAAAWAMTLADPGAGVESVTDALNWALRTDAEALERWGRLIHAVLAEDPALGFCSPLSFRPAAQMELWRALLLPWGDERCIARYQKGRRALWPGWTLATKDESFASGFNSPRAGELVPLILRIATPPYTPAFRLWDLEAVSSHPELGEVLLAPLTVVEAMEEPQKDLQGRWHVDLCATGQLLSDQDLVVATVLVIPSGFETGVGAALARAAWYGCMPSWFTRGSDGGGWRRVFGSISVVGLFRDHEVAAAWMAEQAELHCGLVFRVVAAEACAGLLLRSYYFAGGLGFTAGAPAEVMVLLPHGAEGLAEDLSDLGMVQVGDVAAAEGFIRRPHYHLARDEWRDLRDTAPPAFDAVWYCWRRVGQHGVVYGDAGPVGRGSADGGTEEEVAVGRVAGLEEWRRLIDTDGVKRRHAPLQDEPGLSEEDAAAAKIQALQRGKLARREAAERRRQKVEKAKREEDAAASKIQAMQRGRMARREVSVRKEKRAAALAAESPRG